MKYTQTSFKKSFLIISAITLIFAGLYYVSVVKQIDPLGTFLKPKTCGIESCHGLSLSCGSNVPQTCTTEYQLGDRCRELARCETADGNCRLSVTEEFTACKACSEKCGQDFAGNPPDMFLCESKCGNPR